MRENLKRRAGALLCMALLALGAALFIRTQDVSRRGSGALPWLSNEAQVVAQIRHGLRVHASCITVRFRCPEVPMDDLTAAAADWVEEAMAETENPTEGDYIRYQYGGYEIACRWEADGTARQYTVEITPRYYLYLVQEEAVTERLESLYTEFAFDGQTSDYEKLRTIYSYVCEHIRYDEVHKKHPYFHQRSTAYAALIQQTATCQGYSVLLYRMLRENGIDCRVVTGVVDGDGEFHAWNIAKLDGAYYYLDATWDAGSDAWQWFLKGADSMENHRADSEFLTDSARYPLAQHDYPCPEELFAKSP